MPRPLVALVSLVTVAVTGLCSCSSGDSKTADPDPATVTAPAASAFTAGDCSTAAQAILGAGTVLGELGEQPPADDVLTRIAAAQTALATAATSARGITADLQQLQAGLGFIRLRTASNSYAVDLRDAVIDDYTRVTASCTGHPLPTPTATASPGFVPAPAPS